MYDCSVGPQCDVPHRLASPVSRRTVLTGALAGWLLTACGGGGSSGGTSSIASGVGPAVDDGKGLALVRFFDDPSVIVGTSRRLVFGLAQADGTLRDDGPDQVQGELLDPSGASLGAVVGTRRAKDLFRQYYQFRVDVAAEGIYTLRVADAGEVAESSFTVVAVGALPYPSPGDTMPPFDTPTMTTPGGVDPVCTRDPVCTFHDVTLSGALSSGEQIAYLVGTPAHCQTGVCGPMLDVMVSVRDQYPSVVFVHAEVYADDSATTVAPAVKALELTFEPVLFLIDVSGVVVDRLDVIFDATELTEALDALTT